MCSVIEIETIFDFNVRWYVDGMSRFTIRYPVLTCSTAHFRDRIITESLQIHRPVDMPSSHLTLTPVVVGHPLFPREVVTCRSTTQDSSVTNISPRKHNEAAEHGYRNEKLGCQAVHWKVNSTATYCPCGMWYRIPSDPTDVGIGICSCYFVTLCHVSKWDSIYLIRSLGHGITYRI
jgi:hypothetical protein